MTTTAITPANLARFIQSPSYSDRNVQYHLGLLARTVTVRSAK